VEATIRLLGWAGALVAVAVAAALVVGSVFGSS